VSGLVRAVAVAVVLTSTFAPVRAQTLQRLHVTQLVLGADTSRPKLEVPFHLTVTAHVREQLSSLDNLDLPILAELELLGDEHSLSTSRAGTDYREVITVVAHHTGSITIAPATLDAIDARNGKPTRFSSNPLTLVVGGGSLEPTADAGDLARRALRWVLIGVALAAVIVVAVAIVRRPRPAKVEVITLPSPTPVTVAPRDARAILGDALTTLRAERTRATAMRVRHAIRSLVGASDTETLADALRRPKAKERGMSEVLTTLERAAFTYEADLAAAIGRAIAAIEGVLN
jgi:hypothetical protein